MDELAKGLFSRKVVRSAWDARSGILGRIVDVDSGTRTDVLISSVGMESSKYVLR